MKSQLRVRPVLPPTPWPPYFQVKPSEGHRLYADPSPIDIKFLGDQHRQRGTDTLTQFGLIAADDNVAIRPYFDEEAQPPVVGQIRALAHRRDAEDQAARSRRAADQELAPGDFRGVRAHSSASRIEAAWCIALRTRA
jgi:hypothetical protein